jgi:hypothetical protein
MKPFLLFWCFLEIDLQGRSDFSKRHDGKGYKNSIGDRHDNNLDISRFEEWRIVAVIFVKRGAKEQRESEGR